MHADQESRRTKRLPWLAKARACYINGMSIALPPAPAPKMVSAILPRADEIKAMIDAAMNKSNSPNARLRAWQNYECDRWIDACIELGLSVMSALEAMRGDLYIPARKQFAVRMESLGRFPNGSSWE